MSPPQNAIDRAQFFPVDSSKAKDGFLEMLLLAVMVTMRE